MRRNDIISNPAMHLSTEPKRSPRQLWISHAKESFCPWMNIFQNLPFFTLYSKQIWSKNRPRAVSYFPFGSQQIESMRPKSFPQNVSHRSKGMPENKRPAKQTKNKKDVLAPNSLTGSDQKKARLFSKRFFRENSRSYWKTNKQNCKTNKYLPTANLLYMHKKGFSKIRFVFFRCFRIWVWIISHTVLFRP